MKKAVSRVLGVHIGEPKRIIEAPAPIDIPVQIPDTEHIPEKKTTPMEIPTETVPEKTPVPA